MTPHYQQQFYLRPSFITFFNFSHKRPTFAFTSESGYTRPPSPEPRTQRLTRRNRWRFGWGWYHYPRSVPHVSETLRGRGLKRQTLPLLDLGRVCSRRTQTVNKVVNSPRRKGRVCAENPRRVSCAIEILSFQNFYKVLKTCSAGRKNFFDTLKHRGFQESLGVLFLRWREI